MYNQLYYVRIKEGMTQQNLAERAKVSRRTISDLERTGRIPTVQIGLRLCRALGHDFEEVFPIALSM